MFCVCVCVCICLSVCLCVRTRVHECTNTSVVGVNNYICLLGCLISIALVHQSHCHLQQSAVLCCVFLHSKPVMRETSAEQGAHWPVGVLTGVTPDDVFKQFLSGQMNIADYH